MKKLFLFATLLNLTHARAAFQEKQMPADFLYVKCENPWGSSNSFLEISEMIPDGMPAGITSLTVRLGYGVKQLSIRDCKSAADLINAELKKVKGQDIQLSIDKFDFANPLSLFQKTGEKTVFKVTTSPINLKGTDAIVVCSDRSSLGKFGYALDFGEKTEILSSGVQGYKLLNRIGYGSRGMSLEQCRRAATSLQDSFKKAGDRRLNIDLSSFDFLNPSLVVENALQTNPVLEKLGH